MKNWYAIHTYSGFEKKVKREIEHRAGIEGLREFLGQVLIPEETTEEIKEGKKKKSSRNLMPGYVIIEMAPNEELMKMVRDIKGVSSFVGAGDKATALSNDEVKHMLGLLEDKKDKPRAVIKFKQGDSVKVIEGPFANFVGTIDHIDTEKARLRVLVSIFGRSTPVELDVLQVEGG